MKYLRRRKKGMVIVVGSGTVLVILPVIIWIVVNYRDRAWIADSCHGAYVTSWDETWASLGVSDIRIGPITQALFWGDGIQDRQLERISRIGSLKVLALGYDTVVSDAGLQYFHGSKLESVCLLRCPRITDNSVAVISSFSELRRLDIRGTSISARGRDRIQSALPNCTIQW